MYTTESDASTTDLTNNYSFITTPGYVNDTLPKTPVVFSEFERVCLVIYMWICLFLSLSGNCLLLGLVCRNVLYRSTPHFFIHCNLAVADIMQSSELLPFMMSILLMDRDQLDGPNIVFYCRYIGGLLPYTGLFATLHFFGLSALEKYFYFLHPLIYERECTFLRLAIVTGVIWLIAMLFCVLSSYLTGGRTLFISTLQCQLMTANIVTPVQLVLFFLPSCVVTVFCCYKLGKLLHSHATAVAPLADQQVANNAGAQRSNKKMLKVVGVTSGVFWVTYMPAMICRVTIFATGAKWAVIESGQNMSLFMAMRYSNLILLTTSSAINPYLFMYLHKKLRLALKSLLLCRKLEDED